MESRFDELPLPMLGPDELPGGADDEPEIADERDLTALKDAFDRTPYARRTPYRVEVPFQLTLAGRVVRGRIDAVYRDVDPVTETVTYEIVDWKTGRGRTADPLQLAVYRLAWAEQHGLPGRGHGHLPLRKKRRGGTTRGPARQDRTGTPPPRRRRSPAKGASRTVNGRRDNPGAG